MELLDTMSVMLYMERYSLGKEWNEEDEWIDQVWTHGYNWFDRDSCSFSREKSISREAKVCAIYFRKFTDSILPILFAITGNGDQGVRVAAATYLKNFIRRNMEGSMSSSQLYKEFRDQLAQTLLQAEPAILRVLIEAVSPISLESLATRCLTSKAVLQMTYVLYNFYTTVPPSCWKRFCQG